MSLMKRRRLTGSAIGGLRETQEMLDFCAEHGIASEVHLQIPVPRSVQPLLSGTTSRHRQ
jgi:alcohol dehydrogenase (NADP+)